MSIVLGIESSCDDTAAAVVADGRIASSVVSSQDVHEAYGGVVPELASRDHQRLIVPVVRKALADAGVAETDLTGVAVTHGPGLAGSLLVGLSFAKGLAWQLDVPLIGVNHLEGHLFSLFIGEEDPALPLLCLIVSGGHTQLVLVRDDFSYETMGRTRDDAAGEAFDKVGKLLGLPYPGGPHVDAIAPSGDPSFAAFPRTRLPGFDYSFSGIKTAVLYHLAAVPEDERDSYLEEHRGDLAAAFQRAVVDMLMEPFRRAVRTTGVSDIAIVGGVSANSLLRADVEAFAAEHGLTLRVPALRYCMDNAGMIAMAGYHRLRAGHRSPYSLTAQPALAL